jgi:plastocyanin
MKILLPNLLAAALSAAVAAWTAPAQGYDYVVTIDQNFHPDHLEIKIGDSVIWKNFDADEHTVTSELGSSEPQENGQFDSGRLPSGSSFQYTFLRTGTYRYYDRLHPQMTGKVVVSR